MSSSKKLKMERLSPIPMLYRNCVNLSDSCRTPKYPETPQSILQRRKDSYAIESTSSPEVDTQQTPSSSATSQKLRKVKNSVVRHKMKRVAKKLVSTPLSGLISKKVLGQPRESASQQCVSHNDKSQSHFATTSRLSPIEEAPTTEVAEELLAIGTFYSPLKSTVACPSSRHSEIITPSMAFPKKSTPNPPNNAPLSGIVTKKSTNLNRSFNDSLVILAASEVENDGMEELGDSFKPNRVLEENVLSTPIECFESPAKPPIDKIFKTSFPQDIVNNTISSFNRSWVLDPSKRELCNKETTLMPIISDLKKPVGASVEMCGTERKKRKRALDFGASTISDSAPLDDIAPPVSPVIFQMSCDIPEDNEPKPINQTTFEVPESKFAPRPNLSGNEEVDYASETDSVIEGTPKSACRASSVSQHDTLSGFTVCSSMVVDSYPPLQTMREASPKIEQGHHVSQQNFETIEDESNDCFPGNDCDLKFVVVSNDTSSDDSVVDSIELVQEKSSLNLISAIPRIESSPRKSPPLILNCTKKAIHAFESPAKAAAKAYSEAVNIGVFCSPETNNSHEDQEEIPEPEKEEEVINATTTQEEFVEESEQLRPLKRRKKGSLLERAGCIIPRIDASISLFDYEMKTGLRPCKGKFVSSPLVVCKMWPGENVSFFLVCTPLKMLKAGLQESPVDRLSLIAMIVNKVTPELSEGSVVLLHFPATILYCNSLKLPYVLVDNQLVVHPSEPKMAESQFQKGYEVLFEMFSPAENRILSTSSSLTSLKIFPSASIKTLSDAASCQYLVDDVLLILKVLHVVRFNSDSFNRKVVALCFDEDNYPCWIEFSSERDVKRAIALETLHILNDGSLVQAKGFHVFNRTITDRKTKNILSYCTKEEVNNNIIYTICPAESNWVISSTGAPRDILKTPISVETILSEKVRGRRYLFEVNNVETSEDGNIILKDCHGHSIIFIQGDKACKIRCDSLSVPFILDGVYFYEGKLFSDEYTKMNLKR